MRSFTAREIHQNNLPVSAWAICHGFSNHRRLDCLYRRLFRRRSKKTSKLSVTGLCEENSQVTGEFPTQRISNAENISIWWRHHDSNTLFYFSEIKQCITVVMMTSSKGYVTWWGHTWRAINTSIPRPTWSVYFLVKMSQLIVQRWWYDVTIGYAIVTWHGKSNI